MPFLWDGNNGQLIYQIRKYKIHYDNSFIRRFPHGTEKKHETILNSKSLYFSGIADGTIYLGNTGNPLSVTLIDTMFQNLEKRNISIKNSQISRGVQLRISGSNFYLIDGNISSIFKGSIANWDAWPKWQGTVRFTQPQIIDSTRISFRTLYNKTNENELAVLYFGDDEKLSVKTDLLQKQVDGMFDVDGKLFYDINSKRHVYIYYYRNEFVVSDQNLKFEFKSKTIDTISRTEVKVAYLSGRSEKKLAAPVLIVNKTAAIDKNLLFINSGIIGMYEDKKMWNQAAIIDVYNLTDKAYLSSFYIYNIDNENLKSFVVRDKKLYAIVGDHLVGYKLSGTITKYYKE